MSRGRSVYPKISRTRIAKEGVKCATRLGASSRPGVPGVLLAYVDYHTTPELTLIGSGLCPASVLDFRGFHVVSHVELMPIQTLSVGED